MINGEEKPHRSSMVVVAVNKSKKQVEPPTKSRNSDPNGQPSENIMDSRVFEQRP